jgi:hypothetical protein
MRKLVGDMLKKVVLNGDTAKVIDPKSGEVIAAFKGNVYDSAFSQAIHFLENRNEEGYHEPGLYGAIKLPIARRVMPDAPVLKPGLDGHEYLRAKYGKAGLRWASAKAQSDAKENSAWQKLKRSEGE